MARARTPSSLVIDARKRRRMRAAAREALKSVERLRRLVRREANEIRPPDFLAPIDDAARSLVIVEYAIKRWHL
jgi:hypothetical protein